MVTIINKTNKPIGVIGGQYCLPDQKIVLKDKDALCDVYDEDGVATGEKKLLPGLKAMENRNFISVEIKEDAPKKEAKKAEVTAEKVEEEVKPVKKTTTRKTTKKVEE